MKTSQPVRDYADAGGVRTYYEAVGEGEPVILLHGGMCTVETWGPQVPALSARHRLIMPERRGHGRTADIAGPVTYEDMATDTIAFMQALRLDSAHLVGWSDGAMVALQVAMRRPDLVRKLCFISEALNIGGVRPKFVELRKHLSPAHLPPQLEAAYAAVSPDGPGHYAVVVEKLIALWKKDAGITLDQLATVTAPTLLMFADDDMTTIAHAVAMQEALPSAQLAVIPGTSHALVWEKPDLVNRMLLDFLAPAQAERMFDPLKERAPTA